MKKILFGITGLTLGGAERVLVDVANRLSEKYEITIFTLYSGGELEPELNASIKRKTLFNKKYSELGFMEKKKISLDLLFRKRKLYNKYVKENYDVEIAFLEGPITRLFSAKNKSTRKIAWVHNDVKHVFGTGIQAKIKVLLEKNAYKAYEKLIFVSNDNKKSFEEYFNLDIPKQVIYNYINCQRVIRLGNEDIDTELKKDNINIVSVSRLVEQKAIDRWIKVHSKLKKEGSNQKVYIIGEGPLKEKLLEQIKNEGVEDSFILLGKSRNPYPFIKDADYFALFSYFEGYGMVIEEAKILGKQILITDTAAREAVEKYEYAKIFPNTEEALYEGLKNITEKTQENIANQYNNDERLEQIINLIQGG